MLRFTHGRSNEDNIFHSRISSGLDECLNIEANIDQSNVSFIQDVVLSMIDEGVVAVVPVDTNFDPRISGHYDIRSLRTAQILEWMPRHVRVRLYNDRSGLYEELILPKSMVAIIENPFYAVMNEPNGTAQRLTQALNQLDAIGEHNASVPLDLIIQLPYTIKSEARKQEAEKRIKDINMQLSQSKRGIAYTDGVEKIVQLNRAVEHKLMETVEYLTKLLYGQLGVTEEILLGTADEQVSLNFAQGTIRPIAVAICSEFNRKFTTRTGRTQGQSVMYFKDPFGLVTVDALASAADRFTRNEILSSNEIRSLIGFRPSDDPRADELRNKNLNASPDIAPVMAPAGDAD